MSQKLKKNYWNEIFFLDFFFLRILRYNRLKIHKIFLKNVKYNRNKKLLDVGTTSLLNNTDNIILHECKNNENIVSISNLDCSNLKSYFKKVKFIKGDARNMNLKDNSFDIVYSNATIEHVGSRSSQIKFLKECIRVSRKNIFITTPNKFYPIEFHTKIPLLHFLPNKIFRKILLFLGLTFFAKEKNLNLLSEADLKRFCYRLKIQNYKIIRHKFLFFTSNLILHILKKL
jgi:hypothetical protein